MFIHLQAGKLQEAYLGFRERDIRATENHHRLMVLGQSFAYLKTAVKMSNTKDMLTVTGYLHCLVFPADGSTLREATVRVSSLFVSGFHFRYSVICVTQGE